MLIFIQIGQGLGKNSEGYAEPIKVDIKLNRKGLVSQNENKTNHESPIVQSCGKRIDLNILLVTKKIVKIYLILKMASIQ
jgi:hypothetical protein